MAKQHCIVDQQRLHSLYDYDQETGELTSKLYGKPVGHLHSGYLVIILWHQGKEKRFKVHSLIWMYVHGKWPNPMIDHINGIKTDNRICNLREVTNKQNCENKKCNPASGYRGVHWYKPSKKWKASIGHNGKCIYLGLFDDPYLAYLHYVQAALKLHTHNPVITSNI